MSQALLFLVAQLMGVSVTLAVGPYKHPALVSALAFPVGLAVGVFAALFFLAVGVPYNIWTMSIVVLLVTSLAVSGIVRRRIEPRILLVALAGSAVFGALACALSYYNFSVMSTDSHLLLVLAGVVGREGRLSADAAAQLSDWGVFQVVAHSMAEFTSQDYLYALPPVFGASFVGVFVITLMLGVQAIGEPAARDLRTARLLVGLATVALFSGYMVYRSLFYIHTNFAVAAYLFCFVVLFWLAEQTGDPSGLPIAFVCLLASTLQRIEGPGPALVALALTLQSKLPRRVITPWLLAFSLGSAGWYLRLALDVPQDGFLTPGRCYLAAAILSGFFVVWLAAERPFLRRLTEKLPLLIVLSFALALAVAFGLRPSHMWTCLHMWARNLFELPYWGHTWYLLALLIPLVIWLERPRFHQVFSVLIFANVAFTLLLGLGREPFRFGVGDSANRMTLHILPLLMYYVAIKIAQPLAYPKGVSASALDRASASQV